ncbi:hypothetical protein D3C84_1067240 [compost metagenome]
MCRQKRPGFKQGLQPAQKAFTLATVMFLRAFGMAFGVFVAIQVQLEHLVVFFDQRCRQRLAFGIVP